MTEQNNGPAPLTAEVAEMQRDMAAGTPGPWKVFTTSDGGRIIGIGDDEAGGVTDARFGLWRDGNEQKANARRIARLPDLEAAYISLATQLAGRDAELADAHWDLDNARQIERNVQAVREHEYKRAEAALAELARVTAEYEDAFARGAAWGQKILKDTGKLVIIDDPKLTEALARIAALTEALQRQNTAAEGLLAAEARKSPVGFYLSKLGVEVLNARAALTTDKEPTP